MNLLTWMRTFDLLVAHGVPEARAVWLAADPSIAEEVRRLPRNEPAAWRHLAHPT